VFKLSVLLLLATLLGLPTGRAQGELERVTVIGPGGRQAIAISHLANVPMVPLDEVSPFVGGSMRPGADKSSIVFLVGARSAELSSGRSLVQSGGKLILLSAPATMRAGRWFVPLDFLEKVLPLLAGEKVTYREDSRLLVLGRGFPRLSVRSFPYPTYTRVVLESSSPVSFQVSQVGNQVRVWMPVAYLESDFSREVLRDGVVERITLSRREDGYLLTVDLGERFGTLKAFELGSPSRTVLDLFRSRVPTEPELIQPQPPVEPPVEPTPREDVFPPMAPPELPRVVDRPATTDLTPGVLSTITLDPGHGGSESGATGRNGLQEKDVALAIVHQLQRLLEDRLGVRVVLTRDADQYLSLDERTAIANSNKSNLFLSIHANASPRSTARGSEVYFLSYEATDDESRRVAAAENASAVNQPRSRGDADLEFILWDMAQAAYLNESGTLAEILQEELRAGSAGSRNRGIKQAPFRVLMGATMPAALIEIGFITNPEEERKLGSRPYQEHVAQAIFRGVLKYKERFERQSSVRGSSPGGSSGQRPR
jgi:N-acetylmuramoyl-L-alanine amidase